MPDALIREYRHVPMDDRIGDAIPVPEDGDHVTDQKVTFTTSAQSAAFQPTTKYIEVFCASVAHYKVGENPTATANMIAIPAGQWKAIGVSGGDKIAFYDGTS